MPGERKRRCLACFLANPNLIQILNAAILHLTSDDVKVVKNYFQTDGKREEIKMKNYFTTKATAQRSTINELSSHTLYTLPITPDTLYPLDTAISRDWHNRLLNRDSEQIEM